jgi:hypothetical protein
MKEGMLMFKLRIRTEFFALCLACIVLVPTIGFAAGPPSGSTGNNGGKGVPTPTPTPTPVPTGGKIIPITTIVLPMIDRIPDGLGNLGGSFNGLTPQGTVTFALQGLNPVGVDVEFSGIGLPDGSVVWIAFTETSQQGRIVSTGGQVLFPVIIENGAGSYVNTTVAQNFVAPSLGSTAVGIGTIDPDPSQSIFFLNASMGGVGPGL